MDRFIRIREEHSGLNCRVRLLDPEAPRAAAVLWMLAGASGMYPAQHAMWTGPEISCPVPVSRFADATIVEGLHLENGTSFPAAGDVATVYVHGRTWRGMPDAGVFDIGIFYAEGARLLMPMGWIMASIAGRVVSEDMPQLQEACSAIRKRGLCELSLRRDSGCCDGSPPVELGALRGRNGV